jgi:hypothetical protein
MRRLALIALLLFAPSVAGAAYLTGMTPSNYSLPTDWSVVRTQNFEGSCPSGEECGVWGATMTTTRPHTGNRSLQGTYAGDQSSAEWILDEGVIGSFTEVYLSFYEYIESQALFNDEIFLAKFAVTSPVYQEVLADWYWAESSGSSFSPSFNGPYATLYIIPQGPRDARLAGKKAAVPKGSWVQWEIHYRPNTPGNTDGFFRIYKDGSSYLSVENADTNSNVDMTSMMIMVGGTYTKLVWMEDYPTCTVCSTKPGGDSENGTDACTLYKGWNGQLFSNPVCSPTDPSLPSFKRYFDDIIVMKYGGDPVEPPPPGGDPSPPYTSGRSPASGDTNVATTTRTVTAHILDTDSGVGLSSIRMAVGKNNGAKTEYTCASGLTCSGSSTDYTVTRTMTSDWTAGDIVQVNINASDLASPPNVMTQDSYSYQIATVSGGPYPASTVITAVNWNFADRLTLAPGSDLWPMTWAADDNVYALGGDGGGFNGDDAKCRARTTLARITGVPPSITGTNISGCKADGTGCASGATHDAACDSGYATGWNGVPDTILAVGNTLYTYSWMFNSPDGSRQLFYTANFGQTWTTGFEWTHNPGDFTPGNFLQFGAGYTGAIDNTFVYVYGSKIGSRGTYLARVPKGSIQTKTSYTFYTGVGPGWGTWGLAVPVFYHTDGNGGINVVYFPVIGRYIAAGLHGIAADDPSESPIQALGMFESINPWGPWYTIYYSSTWGSFGTNHGLSNNINTKWLSTDNKTFYMTFSGPGYDNFNLVKGTLVIGTPSPPGGVTIGSYFYGPYLYGTMY